MAHWTRPEIKPNQNRKFNKQNFKLFFYIKRSKYSTTNQIDNSYSDIQLIFFYIAFHYLNSYPTEEYI